MKHLAVLGSSGGNLYNQGGNDPQGMMKEIFNQADSAGIEVSYVQFVGTSGSMDGISMDAKARLYTLSGDKAVTASEEKTLREINELAKEKDKELAQLIRDGKIDGIMLMSCDPKGINHEALTAAAEKKVPVAGTGGTSMADTQSLGCRVIAASGTTGTTNRTRAVSAVAAFSKEWGIKYRPVIGSGSGKVQEGNVWKRINFRGIMMASMPGFIAMAICLALSKIPGLGIDGGIIGGIAVGILSGVLVYYISQFCFSHRVPGTTTNIAAGGLGGLIAGLVGMFLIAPVALFLGNAIKDAIDWAINFNGALAGLIAGFAIWFAIMGGVYHAAILPIILLEMESQGFSFLGAVDLCGLVMVCAGIQLANIVLPKSKGDRVACIPNLFINLVFGTFVEAAYPFMFGSKKVFASAIAAATLSGLAIGLLNVKCTAYVPCFVAPFVSNDKIVGTILCMVIAMGLAFLFTLLSNLSDRKKEVK